MTKVRMVQSVTAPVLAVLALTVLTACGDDSDAVGAQPSAAAVWADTVTCPATVEEMKAQNGVTVWEYSETASPVPTPTGTPAPQREGTTTSILPPGEVTAVVRCDAVGEQVAATAPPPPGAVGGGTMTSRTVQRTVLTDAQPLSWFSDGDHWPSSTTENWAATEAHSVVTVHYASGPDVTVVTSWANGGSSVGSILTMNGSMSCRTPLEQTKAVTTCRPFGGKEFTAPIRPVAAGAPPVDCPSATQIEGAVASPSPVATASAPAGAADAVVPSDGLVVGVVCRAAVGSVVGPVTVWGEAAKRRFGAVPVATMTFGGRCLALSPSCVPGVSQTYLGYTAGPAGVRLATEDASTFDGAVAWLPDAKRGGVTNGVLACPFTPADTSPRGIATCTPFPVATSP